MSVFAPSPHFSALVNAASEAKEAQVPGQESVPGGMSVLALDGEENDPGLSTENRPLKRAKVSNKKKTKEEQVGVVLLTVVMAVTTLDLLCV